MTSSVAQTPLPPPVAKRVDTRREYHGDVFVDPYEWLRDKADPEVVAYLEAENDYVDQATAHLEPLRQQIFGEIKARTKETDLSVPTRQSDWWYYARTFEGKQYRAQCRCPVTDPDDWNPPTLDESTEIPGDQILLDSDIGSEGEDFFPLRGASAGLDCRQRWRRTLYVALQGFTPWRDVPRRDRRYRCRSDVGCRQPHRLLRDLGRRPPSRQGVAVSVGLGRAVGAGVSRSRRTLLARGGAHPQGNPC